MSQLTEMIPEVAPDHHRLLVKMASAIQSDPYSAEIIQEMDAIVKKAHFKYGSMEKTAMGPKSLRKPWRIAKGVGAAMAVMTAGGIAMALAGDLYESAKRGLTRGRDFKAMLEANPDLRSPSKAAKVKASFSTLHRFNPEFAKDPSVAGAYVRSGIDMPGMELNTAKDLVQARTNIQKSKELPSMGNAPASILYG